MKITAFLLAAVALLSAHAHSLELSHDENRGLRQNDRTSFFGKWKSKWAIAKPVSKKPTIRIPAVNLNAPVGNVNVGGGGGAASGPTGGEAGHGQVQCCGCKCFSLSPPACCWSCDC